MAYWQGSEGLPTSVMCVDTTSALLRTSRLSAAGCLAPGRNLGWAKVGHRGAAEARQVPLCGAPAEAPVTRCRPIGDLRCPGLVA